MRVNIIGAGLAGLSAALCLAENGIKSNLISSQASERAQSVMAEGGINACLNTMGEDDKIEYHFEDTMRGGVWLADPNAVRNLCQNAPAIVEKFKSLGVPFSLNEKGIVQRSFGGQKKKRTAFVKSSTGKILMTALIDEVRKHEANGTVRRFSNHTLAGLMCSGGFCRGAAVTNDYTRELVTFNGSVILAAGGLNGLFDGLTTGTTQNTSNAAATAFSQGVELCNLEFIQYHPTTVQIQGKRLLISEAARGEGGRLFVKRNGEPWYFMEEKYPELKNLMPRDVVSAEIVNVTSMPECEPQVYLDMTSVGASVWEKRLNDLREQCIHYMMLDPAIEPIPVAPGIHYFMGGVRVDENHRTSVKNLYAAGECACQYHGANRLGGNSLLGAAFGGQKAARTVISEYKAHFAECEGAENEGGIPEAFAAVSPALSQKISRILYDSLPIIRTEASMLKAREELRGILQGVENTAEKNRVLLALATVESALARKESRGAHKRSDFPQMSAEFKKHTVASLENGNIKIRFCDIPERRAADEDNS